MSICRDCGGASLQQAIDVELEKSGGVKSQNFGSLLIRQLSHLTFYGFGRMRPRTLMMRIVVRPEEVVDEIELHGERQTGAVLLERDRAVRPKILARQHLELWLRQHVMFNVSLVHRVERPRDPSDSRFDRCKFDSRETFKDT